MMEKTYASVSVAKWNSERQHSLEVNIKGSCSKSVTEKERGGDHLETEVMVERVSSTTEHNPLTVCEKLLDAAKTVLPDKIPNAKAMSEQHVHSRTPGRDVSKSKVNNLSHWSPFGGKDKKYRRQLQGTHSLSRKDKTSHLHTSMKKHIPREDKQAESKVSSSSLASASPGNSLPATTQIRPGSSTHPDRKFNSIDSKPVTKFHNEQDKPARLPTGDVNTYIKHENSPAKNCSQNMAKQKYSRQNKETISKQGSLKEYGSSSHYDRNRESSTYEKMVEMKVREIRNNLKRMSNEARSSLVGSVSKDSFSESRPQEDKRSGKGYEEQDSQTVAFLPSSRYCAPPPPPTNITKYWSDAEETEDESDVETHLMHINSVNIVLNFLKRNSEKYYIDRRAVSTQNTGDKTMHVKMNSKSNIKERLSYQPHTASRHARSKSVHARKHARSDKRKGMSMSPTEQYHAGSTMREHRSPANEHHGRSSKSRSPMLAEKSSWRDQWSRSPSKHREFYDRNRSLSSSSGHKRRHYSRSCSPPDYQESSLKNRGSRSPPRYRDHIYKRSSSPQGNKGNFPRDRGSGSPPRYRVRPNRESCSPSKYRGSQSHMWDAEDSLRNRGSLSPMLNEESTYRNREFSPQSSQRSSCQKSPEWHAHFDPRKQTPHGTETNRHSENLHFPPLNPQKELKGDYDKCGAFGPSDLHQHHADSRQQYFSHELSQKDCAMSQDSEMQLKRKDSSLKSRSGYGFSPSSQHGLESPRSGSPGGSAEPHASVMRQELDPGRHRSRSNEKNVLSRWQLSRRESENKLPLEFGKGAKKAWNSGEASRWEGNSLSFDNRKPQKKNINISGNCDHFFSATGENTSEYQRGIKKDQGQRGQRHLEEDSILNISSGKDANSSTRVAQEYIAAPQMKVMTLEDDEPTIDRPEDYLTVSSTVSTYHRPSFVPDAHDRQKLASLAEINELLQTQEDLSVPGPSGITSVYSFGGKERDDPPYWLSDSGYDQEIEDVGSTVPQVSPPATSQEAAPYEEATSGTQNVAELSSVVKDITTQVARKEEEKEFLTLNSAEMSTLLTLIKLAKEHVATGNNLPTNLSQMLETGHDTNNSKISEPQGDQSGKNQEQQPSVSWISAGLKDKAGNKETIKATTSKSNTKNNRNSDDRQSNKKDVTSVTNEKNGTIPKGKKDEIVLERKTNDNLSETKGNNKPSQSKSKPQKSKTDDKLPKSKKSHEQSSGKNVDETISQEKCKEKGQSSKDGEHVKETLSKKKVNHKDQAKRQSKSKSKGTVVERTFAEMQSVRVDLSVSHEVVASSGRGKHYKVKRTTTLWNPKKKQLKQVGKRILIEDSSDSDSDDSKFTEDEKDAPPEADNHPQDVHPLHQETIVLDHSVNTCLACKHSLKPDEFTSIFLNTGTVTMRCRNCHTYTRMEKVISRDYYTAISMPKKTASKAACNVPSKTSETSEPSVDNNNSKVNKKGNVMASSEQEQNENTNKKGGFLDSDKQAKKEKKHSSQELKNAVKEGKVEISACKKGIGKKVKSADADNASKTISVFKSSKEDKCQKDRKESERSSSTNKGTDYEMSEKEQKLLVSEFDSIDPSLRVFPWTSSRKRKKLYEDLILNEGSSDSDGCNKKQQHEKPHKKRKRDSSTKRKHNEDDETSTCPGKSTKVVKSTTTTKSSDPVKINSSTKSAVNTNPRMKDRKLDVPKSSMTTKATTATKSTTTPKPTMTPKSTTTPKLTTAPKSTSAPKGSMETKFSSASKPITERKSTTDTKSSSVARFTAGIKSSSAPKLSTPAIFVITIKSDSDATKSTDT